MPVSRNLSLPSSIEGGKFKKRPADLHDLKQSTLPTSSNQNSNRNNNRSGFAAVEVNDVTVDSSDATQATSQNRPQLFGNRFDKGSSSSMSRGSLSHPCLSENDNVGATVIFPHLFLGSQKDVTDEDMMSENNILNVLNVSCSCERPQHLDDDHFHRIAVRDNYQEKITPYLNEAIQFIESARKKNERVLVHCLAGVSRSATIAIAYVMYYLRLNSDDAYRFVKDRRPTISPNFNFLGQLMDYEKQLRDCGHMIRPRVGSISNDVISDGPIAVDLTAFGAQSNASQLQPAVVTPITLHPSCVFTSALCRRPNLHRVENSRRGRDEVSSRFVAGDASVGAGVVLELHVSDTAVKAGSSRQLGSDGMEKDECESELRSTLSSSATGCDQTSRFIEPPSTIKPLFESQNPVLFESSFLSKVSDKAPFNFCVSGQKATNFTSVEINVDPHVFHHQACRDIEMDDIDNCNDVVSPPSPVSSSSYLCGPFERSSSLSPKPDRLSRKSRSPKIMRKSWRPPYDCVASRVGKLSNSSVNGLSFRSLGPTVPHLASHHCASPSVAISSLTLNSPAFTLRGENLKSSSVVPSSECLTSHSASNCKIGTKEPFRLVSGSELKPKWRNRKSSDTDSALMRPSSAASLSSTSAVLNRQNSNIGNIVSCS